MIKLFEDFLEMDAMKYYDKSDDNKLSENLLKKKYDIINNKNAEYIASQKWDGNWMMFYKGQDGSIYVRGRNRNVKNLYENYAPKIPHIVNEFNQFPSGSVVLAEVCWAELGKVATDVGTILRCLPEKAVARQKDHKLVAKVFDILAYDNLVLVDEQYEKRLQFLSKIPANLQYIAPTIFFENDFAENADKIIAKGGEGIVIQRKDNKYEPGKRTAWHTLKLKQKLPEIELPVVGVLEPEKRYNGIEESIWNFWEYNDTLSGDITLLDHYPTNDDYFGQDYIKLTPVTKPYFYGWKVGVIVKYNGNEVKVSSGTCDADREWLASGEAAELIKQGKLYAVIKGMQETTNMDGTKSIRHPVLVRLRADV